MVIKTSRGASNLAAGPDCLLGCFYRVLADELVPSLSVIFQQSFLGGRIPDMWRVASIKLIFKKDAKDVAANCRLISLICVACK